MIEKFVSHQTLNGFFQQKRKDQNQFAFQRLLQDYLNRYLQMQAGYKEKIASLKMAIAKDEISPYTAVQEISSFIK